MENMNIVNYCGQVEGYTIIIRAKEIRVIERWSRQQKQAYSLQRKKVRNLLINKSSLLKLEILE